MPTHELADPTAQEAEQRVERAKASLRSRVELLAHKLTDVKNGLDLRAQIAKHPWPAVGIACALGVAAALQHKRTATPTSAPGRALTATLFAGVAAVGLRIVRELALHELGRVVKQWAEGTGESAAEARGSQLSDVEAFLEH